MAHPAPRRWYPITFTVAALVLLPLSVLLLSWLEIDREIWSHLWDTQLPRLLGNTLTLVLGVGIGVTLLGVSLAWLTSLCEFPGRRWLDWALMLPFAIPAYVLAFVFVGLLDFAGPVQSLLREWFGSGLRLPRVRSTGGVILVLVLVFYPYVYLLARSAFIAQGKGLMEAARVLGLSPWQAFLRVALPMARPAIGAGLALAVMETLADFGAVSVFNFDTFTTAIYKTWYGFYSLSSAAQLASLLLLGVCLVLLGERHTRGRAKAASERPRGAPLYRLRGARALAASAWCGLVFLCAFVIPVAQLVVWFWRQGRFDLDERYWDLIGHTLTLGGIAALATVAVAQRAQLIAGVTQSHLHLLVCEKRRDHSAALNDLAQELREEGYSVSTNQAWKDSLHQTIIAEQQAEGCGLIIKQHFPDNPLKKAILTPDDWKLLRFAPCPVLMTKTARPWTGGKIIAAVDVGNNDGEHRSLHAGIISHAYDIAGLAKATLHVISAHPSPMLSSADPTFQLSETIEARYREACRTFQAEYGFSDEQLHIEEGPADVLIPRTAQKLDAVVTVIGTVARTGLSGALIGNTAEVVLDTLESDVLVLKPDDIIAHLEELASKE